MILYRPSEALLMPGALLLGMGAGYSLSLQHLGFTAACQKKGKIKTLTLLVRFLLGMTITFLIFTVSAKLAPQKPTSDYNLLYVFIRYGLAAIWIFAGAPWLFIRLKLAEKLLPADSSEKENQAVPESGE
jgi:hypothetical protein